MEPASEYLVQCWNCLGEFDAVAAVWCGCSSVTPTKICPFCMLCFCGADPLYVSHFWEGAPGSLEAERADLGKTRQRLGDLLVREGAVTEEDLARALERKADSGERLGEALVSIGALSAEELEVWLGRHQGSFSADVSHASVQPRLVRQVGVDLCYEKTLLPLEVQSLGASRILTLAMADPSDSEVIEEVGRRMACRVIAEFAEAEEIREVLRNAFPREESGVRGSRDVRRQLLGWVASAIQEGATHIHLRCDRQRLHVGLRVSGLTHEVADYPKKDLPYVLREIRKLVHHPQDQPFARGRTTAKVGDRRYQLTVRVRETEHGEDVAVRVVDIERFGRELEAEVPAAQAREALAVALHRPGITVISSPLYHGRLDTSYALLWKEHEMQTGPVVLERQMACPLPDVDQRELEPSQLGEALGSLSGQGPLFLHDLLGPAHLETVLRIAESRPVLATVVARRLTAFLESLLEAADDEHLAGTLRLLTNQRQVRRNCPECRIPDEEPPPSVYLGLDESRREGPEWGMRGAGCEGCDGSGYRGRITVHEVLPVEGPVRDLIQAAAPSEVILQEGVQAGGVSLRMAFLDAVGRGEIRLRELERVSF